MRNAPTLLTTSFRLASSAVLIVLAAAAAPLALAQSGDPNADAMKQVQQMQNDPRYKEMMKNPGMQEMMRKATENAAKTPVVAGGVARTGLPKRDEARLATVSRVAPTQVQLAAYIPKVHAAVMNRLAADQRSAVLDLIAQLKADSPGSLEAAASNLWIMGKPDLAVLLMGQAASDHPDQPNTLNNYAAFLTMLGGEPEAIPILQRLAQQFPNDSTVQSNLGQAWFGLGDIAEAKKHLDNAVRIFPGHSQANETIADIDEANGDPVGETQALERSIKTSYSEEKAARLEKLGKKTDPYKIPWRVHMAQDPMGLEQFKTPAFCKGVDDAKDCSARWQEFDDQLSSKLEVLSAKYTKVQQQIIDRSKKASDKAQAPHASLSDMMSAANDLAKTTGLAELANSPMTAVAQPRYHAAIDDLSQLDSKIKADTAPIYAQIAEVQKTYGAKRKEIEQKYAPLFGEGEAPGIEEQYCSAIDGVEGSESAEVNPLLENAYQLSRPRILRAYNDYVYYSQFENDDLSFEAVKIHQQQMFLAWLSGIHGAPYEGSRCTKKKPQKQSMMLQDFYDVHCEHIITFSVPKIGSFDVHCNKMTTKLDLSVKLGEVTLSAKGTMKENLDTSRIIGGRVEQGAKIGVDEKVGPVKVSASAEGKSFVEFDDHGVTNVGGGLSGTVGAGPANITVDSNVSWDAGATGSGSATLAGMTVMQR